MSGYCKYYKQKKQVSYDSGATWQDVVPYEYQKGSLYESGSPDCGSSTIERWVNSGTTCSGTSGYDKYNLQVKQISYDEGSTWTTTSDYQLGGLIQRNSTDCGYVPSEVYEWFLLDEYICDDCDAYGYEIITTSGDTVISGCTNDGIFNRPSILNIYQLAIGDCYTSIGNGALSGITSLSVVSMPSTITNIGNDAFSGCSSLIDAAIPNSVTEIGNGAFSGCTSLQSVFLPNGLTSIGERVFAYCFNFWTINIPSGITSIPNRCFYHCGGLSDIELHSGITNIGEMAFAYCEGLNNITLYSTTPPTLGTNALSNTNNCQIYVPAASVNAYKTASGWSDYASRIQAIQ